MTVPIKHRTTLLVEGWNVGFNKVAFTTAPATVGNQSAPDRLLQPAGCEVPLQSRLRMPSAVP